MSFLAVPTSSLPQIERVALKLSFVAFRVLMLSSTYCNSQSEIELTELFKNSSLLNP